MVELSTVVVGPDGADDEVMKAKVVGVGSVVFSSSNSSLNDVVVGCNGVVEVSVGSGVVVGCEINSCSVVTFEVLDAGDRVVINGLNVDGCLVGGKGTRVMRVCLVVVLSVVGDGVVAIGVK